MKSSIHRVMLSAASVIAACTGITPDSARALDYFYTNFNSSLPTEFTSVVGFSREAIETTNSPNYTDYLPFTSGSWLRTTSGTTQSATLTLTDLPVHDLIDLRFLIGVMDSIDSTDGPFEVKVDGATIYSREYGSGGSWDPGEPTLIVRQTQLGYHLGEDSWWTDGGYNMGLVSEFKSIAHTADSVTIEFASGLSSPGLDESYAIDNVQVDFRLTPYYQANFDSGMPAEFSATTGFNIETVTSRARPDADYLDYGFSGNWLRASTNNGSQTTTLTLTDLPSHTYIDLDFLLAAVDSIDSDDGPFTVTVDGEVIFSEHIGSTYVPAEPITLVRGKQLGGNLGEESWLVDDAYRMGLLPEFSNIAHTADTLTIVFSSGLSTPGSDESYAIDNLTIALGVPEPSTSLLLLLLAGMGLIGSWRRR